MAPVLEVADVFRRHGEAFQQAREGHLGYVERRVMGAKPPFGGPEQVLAYLGRYTIASPSPTAA